MIPKLLIERLKVGRRLHCQLAQYICHTHPIMTAYTLRELALAAR